MTTHRSSIGFCPMHLRNPAPVILLGAVVSFRRPDRRRNRQADR
jgi:hypothetical protein